jgi:phage terminase large subunit GpA-like protein
MQLSLQFDRNVIERIREEAGLESEPTKRGRGRPIHAPVLEMLDVSDLPERISVTDIDPDDPWTERERSAWAPPEDLRVSEWAEQYRMLPSKTSAAPGKWSNIPFYTVEVMDSFVDPWVETITVMAAVQSSKTESIYNMLGFAICQDPAPVLVVMPTLGLMKRANKKILGMIRESTEMARHITSNQDDITKSEIQLDNLCITFATAGSTADLRNVEVRYCLMDETDDYPLEVSEQGSPIEMATARTTTFWNRKIIHVCTPTTDEGYIAQEYSRSDQSKYWVPCPYCKGYQQLDFFRIKHRGERLGQWPKDRRDPDYIRLHRVARYECEHCGAEIDDRDKRWMLRFGTWVPDGHSIDKDGSVAIPRPKAIHRGFHWSSLYSPWRSFSDIAAQFFKTKDDPQTYKTFVNLWLGKPWKQVVETIEESKILNARVDLDPQTVPRESVALTAFIDCQKYGFWFAVRAWAADYTSWLIHYGQLPTWDDVERLLFETEYPVADGGGIAKIWRAGVDVGGTKHEESSASMTEEAELWVRANGVGRGARVWATKGSSTPLAGKLKIGQPLDKTPSGKPLPGGLQIVSLDTSKLKDAFHYRLQLAIDKQPGGAYLHSGTNELYASHIAAEEKRTNRRGIEEWVKIRKRNDLLDCEIGNLALADPEWPGGGVKLLGRIQAKPQEQQQPPRNDDQWIKKSSQWLRR